MINKLITNFFRKRKSSPPLHKQAFEKKSYSQCGEDMIIDYIFKLRGIKTPNYLDIGCNHPYYINNTAFFYEKGCRGVNIDANPNLIMVFDKFRNEDINLNVGIGDKKDTLDFFIMKDDTLSTFSEVEYREMQALGKALLEIKKVKIVNVNDIISEYFNNVFPDFLNIDVEGMDFQILQSIDFKLQFPKVICVEAAEYSPTGTGKRRSEMINFLVSKGYYEYANTNLNAIMVKNEFWFI